MGHIDLRLGKIVYISVCCNTSFSWLFPLDGFQFIFFVPYLLCDSETGSIEGPLQPHPLGTRLGGVLRCATNADCRLAGKPRGGGVLPYVGYIGTCRGIGYGF